MATYIELICKDFDISISEQHYFKPHCAVFGKIRYRWGQFQNMHPKFPLSFGDFSCPTSEHLYQASRFPHRPDIQGAILQEESPLGAKGIAREFDKFTRDDWHDGIKILAMIEAISHKIEQYQDIFHPLFEEAKNMPIVEFSNRDAFWGASPLHKGSPVMIGTNMLGQLWDLHKLSFLSKSKIVSTTGYKIELFGAEI
tara:strand:+ start:5232 stop:5825 length:594 start_codon:yes stop_codon:yes gene_type:complete